jgi:hypothetical protein
MNSRGSEIEFEVESYLCDEAEELTNKTIDYIKQNNKAQAWQTLVDV